MDTQLTVADIASIRGLLEAACARGAFRANEMSHVGVLYDKISLFLDQTSNRMQQPQTPPPGDIDA